MNKLGVSRVLAVLVVVALAAASCTGDDDDEAPVLSPSTKAGCRGPAERLDNAQTIESSGDRRTYQLALPEGDGRTPRPLLLNFHGTGRTALGHNGYTNLDADARRRGMIVVTPDAQDGLWDLGQLDGAERTDPSGSVDLQMVDDLLATLDRRLCIDPDRVYAAGLSLGAVFASVAACAFPDRIAAAGFVTVELLLEPCPDAVSVVAFHGTADPLVPYEGGPVRGFPLEVPAAEENMRRWAALADCDPEPQSQDLTDEVNRRAYDGCRPGTDVVLYTIDGGGHTWPGASTDIPGLGPTTRDIDANTAILDYFENHPPAS